MRTKRRSETGKENLRQEIMDAARELFAAEGCENVSMRRIADRIGYSATTIYLYFEDRSDLLHQICEETFARLTENISSISRLSADPLEKLRLGMREYIYFGLRYPSHYEIVFVKPLPRSVRGGFDEPKGREAFGTLRAAVAECAAENLLKSEDTELVSQTLWAGIHGVTSLLIMQKDFPFVERERLIDSVLDTLIAGVTA